MNNDMLENQLRSWTPRRPSDKIAQRLFGAAPKTDATRSVDLFRALRAPGLWQWLTPAAACFITMVVFISGASQRGIQGDSGECATFYATIMANTAHQSNSVRQTFAMHRATVNMEWNVIPGFSYDTAIPSSIVPAAVRSETNVSVRND